MKRTVPLLIAALTGWVMVAAYFVPSAQSWGDTATSWFNILAAAALVLGGGNLVKVQLASISKREAGWGYAAITLIAFVITVAIGLFKIGIHPSEQHPTFRWSGGYLDEGSGLWWLYEYILYPVTTTMFCMLAFFVASAAFRAFRAKNLLAVILLATALLVLLGRTYAGVWLTQWMPEGYRLNSAIDFVMDTFNTAGTRAIKIGIALGIVTASLKILLGMDRSYVGGDE